MDRQTEKLSLAENLLARRVVFFIVGQKTNYLFPLHRIRGIKSFSPFPKGNNFVRHIENKQYFS